MAAGLTKAGGSDRAHEGRLGVPQADLLARQAEQVVEQLCGRGGRGAERANQRRAGRNNRHNGQAYQKTSALRASGVAQSQAPEPELRVVVGVDKQVRFGPALDEPGQRFSEDGTAECQLRGACARTPRPRRVKLLASAIHMSRRAGRRLPVWTNLAAVGWDGHGLPQLHHLQRKRLQRICAAKLALFGAGGECRVRERVREPDMYAAVRGTYPLVRDRELDEGARDQGLLPAGGIRKHVPGQQYEPVRGFAQHAGAGICVHVRC